MNFIAGVVALVAAVFICVCLGVLFLSLVQLVNCLEGLCR